jgi:hypothetical protein
MQPTLAAAALFCFALNTQALTPTGDRDFGSPPPVESTVKFDLYHDYLIVARGSAGPLKGLTFLIDTGASPSVLDPRLAQKLHLQQSPASIAVVGGSVPAGTAIVPSLNLGPIRRENVPVLIEDLSFFQKALPVRIDGVIGLDVLGQSAFLIDYGARQIHFGSHVVLPISIPLRLVKGLAIVDAEAYAGRYRSVVPAALCQKDAGTGKGTEGQRRAAVVRCHRRVCAQAIEPAQP